MFNMKPRMQARALAGNALESIPESELVCMDPSPKAEG